MTGRVRTLDGIRGVAILLVVAGHIASNYQPLDEGLRRWFQAFANSSAGVRLFFVLSGYLITSLLLDEKAATGAISLRRFYWRRGLRIFPAFYVYLLAVTLLSLWRPSGVTGETFAAAATFTWNYSGFWMTPPPEGIWNLGHLWTLALEQQFYLVWPLVLVFGTPRQALVVAGLLMAWCPVARTATYYLFPLQRGLVGMMLHTAIDSLMAGCAAAILVHGETARAKLRAAPGFWAAAAGVWLMLVSPVLGERLRGFPLVAGIALDAIAAGWVIAWLHHAPTPALQRVFGFGLLPALGLISYSLYIWQQVFLSPSGWLADSRILLPLAGALAAACASYWLVEKPALRLKSRRPAPASVA